MSGRRVIVHAGFHKTGTTTTQSFLWENGKHIWPSCALVLPNRIRKSAARMAMRYSRFGTAGLLDEFANDLHSTLSNMNFGRSRSVLISEENLAGRMPGRDGQRSYNATADLMLRLQQVLFDIFGTDIQLTFHFTTRAPDDWLLSTYKHNLRKSRLTLDRDAYFATYKEAANLQSVVDQVSNRLSATVQTADLATLNGPEGPAAPLLDLIGLPADQRQALVPLPPKNVGPQDALIAPLLELNRSTLSDRDLSAAKKDLLKKDAPDVG